MQTHLVVTHEVIRVHHALAWENARGNVVLGRANVQTCAMRRHNTRISQPRPITLDSFDKTS